MGVGREARRAGGTTERESNNLALRLAELDVGSQEAALGKAGPREDRVIYRIADLRGTRRLNISLYLSHASRRRRTLARSRDGAPPAPKKTFRNARGIVSIESS